MKVQRALISVADKSGIVDFARTLKNLGIEIIATGGTAELLREKKVPVKSIAEFTDYPEILDGRVKSFHPKIFGSILFNRQNEDHITQIKEHQLANIDLVVVNLYPFQETVALPHITTDTAIEQIDIGGSALIRAAAKNYLQVGVIVDPADYTNLKRELNVMNLAISERTRELLALKAFRHTAAYDAAIANYLTENFEDDPFPSQLFFAYKKKQNLRYGENPHQSSALYQQPIIMPGDLTTLDQHTGKELSYNNFIDLEVAYNTLHEFDEPVCVIIKHASGCGVCVDEHLDLAYDKALQTDPASAFGGVYGFNRIINAGLARKLSNQNVEVIIAPGYTEEAFIIFKSIMNLRVVKIGDWEKRKNPHNFWEIKQINGGLLLQELDEKFVNKDDLNCVTKRKPTPDEITGLLFADKVAKYVKTDAVVISQNQQTVSIASGYLNREAAVRYAIDEAIESGKSLAGTVLASDGYISSPKSMEKIADAGISAIINPGGAPNDRAMIHIANDLNLSMIFTKIRHFRH